MRKYSTITLLLLVVHATARIEGGYELKHRRTETVVLTLDELQNSQVFERLSWSQDSDPIPLQPFYLVLYDTASGILPVNPSLLLFQEALDEFVTTELNAAYDKNRQVRSCSVAVLTQTTTTPNRRLQTKGSRLATQLDVQFQYQPTPLDIEEKVIQILAGDLSNLVSNVTTRAAAEQDNELTNLNSIRYLGKIPDTSSAVDPDAITVSRESSDDPVGISVWLPLVLVAVCSVLVVGFFLTRKRNLDRNPRSVEADEDELTDDEIMYGTRKDETDIFSVEAGLTPQSQNNKSTSTNLSMDMSNVIEESQEVVYRDPDEEHGQHISSIMTAQLDRNGELIPTTADMEEIQTTGMQFCGSASTLGMAEAHNLPTTSESSPCMNQHSITESKSGIFSLLSGFTSRAEASTVVASNTTSRQSITATQTSRSVIGASPTSDTVYSPRSKQSSLFNFSVDDDEEGENNNLKTDEAEEQRVRTDNLEATDIRKDEISHDLDPKGGQYDNNATSKNNDQANVTSSTIDPTAGNINAFDSLLGDKKLLVDRGSYLVTEATGLRLEDPSPRQINHLDIVHDLAVLEQETLHLKSASPDNKNEGWNNLVLCNVKKDNYCSSPVPTTACVSANECEAIKEYAEPQCNKVIQLQWDNPSKAISNKADAAEFASIVVASSQNKSRFRQSPSRGFHDKELLPTTNKDDEYNYESVNTVDMASSRSRRTTSSAGISDGTSDYQTDTSNVEDMPEKYEISKSLMVVTGLAQNAPLSPEEVEEFLATGKAETKPNESEMNVTDDVSSDRVRIHARNMTGDGSTNYQHETMQNDCSMMEDNMEGEDQVEVVQNVSSPTEQNSRKRRARLSLSQVVFGMKAKNDNKPPRSPRRKPSTPKSPASAQSIQSSSNVFSDKSTVSPVNSEGSTSKQLISDLLWLEQKIAATNQADPGNRVVPPESPSDSLSFASRDDMASPDEGDASIDQSSTTYSVQADDSVHNDSDQNSSSVQPSIVCRDCYAPPGKLKIVIHSTKDGPAVHTVKKGSSLEGHIFAGDLIISVDNVDTRSYSAEQVMKMMTAKTRFERKITVLHFDDANDGGHEGGNNSP